MQYNCKTTPITKLRVLPHGGYERPLCNICRSQDCENPIEKRSVSVCGINEMMRVYVTQTQVSAVVNCDGFVP